jgi:hypothetical protein
MLPSTVAEFCQALCGDEDIDLDGFPELLSSVW